MGKFKEIELPENISILGNEKIYMVICHNDDVHTFDYVIDCLMLHCAHTAEQAEQCAYLIHLKGKCEVKRGSQTKMRKINEQLSICGLTATVEEG